MAAMTEAAHNELPGLPLLRHGSKQVCEHVYSVSPAVYCSIISLASEFRPCFLVKSSKRKTGLLCPYTTNFN